jgi:hypothetical protein
VDSKTFTGSLAEISVIKNLIQDSWDVFTSFNGKTEFDIIAYKEEFGVITIQVKSTSYKKPSGSYEVGLRSIRSNKTKNSIYKFNNEIQDILAIYIVEIDAIIFKISNNITNVSSISINQLDALNLSQETLSEVIRKVV